MWTEEQKREKYRNGSHLKTVSQIDYKRNQHICRATRMEEDPEVTLDIHCLRRGGGAALTSTNNYFLHQRGSGGARAITV